MLKSDFNKCGGVNSPLLILLIVFSTLFHFILADMIVFPHLKNHQTARSLAVSFYKTDNIKNSKKTEQNKDAETVDKETINKKKSVKSEKVHKEPNKKSDEKNIVKKTSKKAEDKKNNSETEEYKTPANNESAKKVVTERYLPKLTFNNERKREINERSNYNVLKNSGNEEEEKKYLEYIRKKITSRIKYPPIARRRGIEGNVLVSFNIKKDGTIKNVELAKKSSYSVLNDAVLKAMNNIVITKTPEESIAVSIPINFTLE